MRHNITVDSEIVPLTSVRGLAALWVVAFHFGMMVERHGYAELGGPVRQLLVSAPFAVDIFFLLSGYILTASYGLKSETGKFFIHRFARIFPLHLFVLSVMAVGIAAAGAMGIQAGDPEYFRWDALPFHITLTFIWVGLPTGWNGPTWSLSAELAAYLTFPVLQRVAARMSRIGAIAATCGLLAAQCAWLFTALDDTGIGAIGRGLLGLAAGAALRLTTYDFRVPPALGVASAATILLLAAIGAVPLAVFPAALLLVALSSNNENSLQRAFSMRPLKWAGDVSYSVYLLHAPLAIVVFLLARRLEITSGAALFVLTAAYVALLAVVSHLAWRLVERPARSAIRRYAQTAPHLTTAMRRY